MSGRCSSTDDPSARVPDPSAPPSRRRRCARAVTGLILASTVMAIAAPAASADPWACDGTGYITQFDAVGTGNDTLFQRVVRQPDGTYDLVTVGTFPVNGENINAIGFRPQDGFIYGYNRTNDQIVLIENDGAGNATFDEIGVPLGLPVGFDTVTATFLPDGTYFLWGSSLGGNVGIIVDVTGPTPLVTDTLTPVAGFQMGSDVAVSPVDGRIYSTNANGVFEIIISGGTLSNGPEVVDAGLSTGAQWFEADGTLIQYENAGSLWAADLDAGTQTRLGPAPAASNVDGTACANGLALTKDASPRTVAAGAELTYTNTITSRAIFANPVDFVDQLPAGLTYVPGGVTVSPPFGTPNAYGGTDTLSISGTLAPQETVTITARVLVAPDHPCNVPVQNQSQASLNAAGLPPVTFQSDDPTTPANPDDPTTAQVSCSADVGIVKTASTSPIVPGEEATFTLVATNHGPSTATNVTVSDQLPSDYSFRSASPGCAEAGGTLTCTVASLAPGASQTFTVTGDVASSLDECLENTATVTSATPDPNAANNTSMTCTPIQGRSNLSLTKAASTPTVAPGGGQVMYTLVVRNRGPSDDPDATVSDPLPAGLTLVAAEASQGRCSTTGNTVSCDLGTLKDGGSAQVLVTANAGATPGCITNVARVRGARVDPTPGNNQASAQVCVQPPPEPPATFDLEVDKRVDVRRPLVGQRVTYRIAVTNNGPDAAPDAKVTDTYNARATVVSVRTPQGTCTRRMPITCELGRIEAGDTVRITVVIRPREVGRARNAASATSCCGTDTTPDNNMDRADIRVRRVPLRLAKVVDRSSVRGGERFSYRIRVRNPTRGQARNVRVCDRLPTGLRYVSSKPRARRSGSQRCWTIERLGARKSRTFRVTVRAANGAQGHKVNRATATSPDARRVTARDPVLVLGQATPVTG